MGKKRRNVLGEDSYWRSGSIFYPTFSVKSIFGFFLRLLTALRRFTPRFRLYFPLLCGTGRHIFPFIYTSHGVLRTLKPNMLWFNLPQVFHSFLHNCTASSPPSCPKCNGFSGWRFTN